MNGRTFGRAGEDIAEAYLKKKGYRIVARNYNTAHGELDVVAIKGLTLVFVEVKAKSTARYGPPAKELTYGKRAHLRVAAAEFCKVDASGRRVPVYIGPFRFTRPYRRLRFDLIELLMRDGVAERIVYTKNAFRA
ncbi:MAG: YraN family protein [Clostridia bacterium]|nr:YraN family protein [Clostridia bacterium]